MPTKILSREKALELLANSPKPCRFDRYSFGRTRLSRLFSQRGFGKVHIVFEGRRPNIVPTWFQRRRAERFLPKYHALILAESFGLD